MSMQVSGTLHAVSLLANGLFTVVFGDFNWKQASGRYHRLPQVPAQENWATWSDDTPRKAVSEDGKSLVYYMPNLSPPESVVNHF